MAGIDSSIYGLIRQPQFASPMEHYGQAMSISNLVGQNQLQGLQRQQLEDAMGRQGRLRDLFAQGKPSIEQVSAIDPEVGFKMRDSELAGRKTEAEIKAKQVAAMKDNLHLHTQGLRTVGEQSAYSAWRANLIRDYPDYAATVPEQFTPELKRTLLLKGEELANSLTPKLERVTLPDGSIRTVDMNPNTNPEAKNFQAPAGMTPAQRDDSARGWAQLNRPTWDAERGVWITPPAAGPRTAQAAPGPSGPAMPPSAPPVAPRGPAAAPRGVPEAIPVPGVQPRPKLTAGQEALDREFAKDLASFKTGGDSDMAKQIAQLRGAADALKTRTDLTGPVRGRLPDAIRAATNPEAIAVRERVEEVVQRSLRTILGAQFTEKEGDRLIARAFNPALGEKENLSRVNRLITQLEQGFKAKADAAAYFEKNGTLSGWQGRLPKISDFDDAGRTDSGRIGDGATPRPKIGHREDGYIYKGGDPAKASSWEKARE